MTPKRLSLVALAAVAALVLSSCAPGARMLSAPTFALDARGSGFVRIDPPGVGDGSALFRLSLVAQNPNPFALRLSALEGDLFLQDVRAAAVSFRGGLELPASGSSRVVVDVRVPLAAAPALLESLANVLGGGRARYRVDASVAVEVLGTTQRFPRFTLVEGSLETGLALVAPSVALGSASLRVEGLNRVAVDMELNVTNPGPIGYLLSSPQLVLQVGGQDAAVARLEPVPVPANGSAVATLSFAFDPFRLGSALADQVRAAAAGGGLAVTLRGGWGLDAAGIATLDLSPTRLLEAVVR
ncbi:MAG TPA: LEA type 2 family protein [Trueperaceae bacterium]